MKIFTIYSDEPYKATKTLLSSYHLEDKIKEKSAKIVLKPNLVTPSLPSFGATTHTEIVVAIIEYLKDYGFNDITISESAWVGSSTLRAFKEHGYYGLVEKYNIALVDNKSDDYETLSSLGITMEISKTALKADYLINIPVLKGHCQTKMTCAVKNLKGCLSDKSKRDFHMLGLTKPIAALSTLLKPDLTIVDSVCGDLDFEEGGNPVKTDMLFLGENSVTTDVYASHLMGFKEDEIGYLKLALSLGLGEREVEVVEINKPRSKREKSKGYVETLSSYTDERNACSACFASLIRAIKKMEDDGEIGKIKNIKIACGQGWKDKECYLGSGSCCRKARINIPGCPPSAYDILSALKRLP